MNAPAKIIPAGVRHRQRFDLEQVTQRVARYGVVIAFVLLVAVVSALKPHVFPTANNATNILSQACATLVLAAVLTVPLAMGDFDLSFAATASLLGALAVVLMTKHGFGTVPAILVIVAAGIAVGVLNGLLVAYAGVSAFIITLAMGFVLSGLELALTDNKTIFGLPGSYTSITSTDVLGLPVIVPIVFVFAGAVWFMLRHTILGRYMEAVGGNPEAAFLSGVNVRLTRAIGFCVVGVGAAFAGVILTSQAASYYSESATGMLLPTYAAVFIGASTLRDGHFHVWGSCVGVLFMATLQTALTVLNQPTWLSNVVQGVLLIAAILLTRLGRSRRKS